MSKKTYILEYSSEDIKGALKIGFAYVETLDNIVGSIYTNPKIMKRIVVEIPNEVEFDYIPEGIGIFRTAYLKIMPVRDNEIRFENQDKDLELRLFLI